MPNVLRRSVTVAGLTAALVAVVVASTLHSPLVAVPVGLVLAGLGLLATIRTLLSGIYFSGDSITIRRTLSRTRLHASQVAHADAEGPYWGEVGAPLTGAVWVNLILSDGVRVNIYRDSVYAADGETPTRAWDLVREINEWLGGYRSRHPPDAANT